MPLHFPSSSPSSSPEAMWVTAFNELGRRIRRYFVRSEPHHQALASMQGLMSGALRKNGWQVAEAMGETTPYAMQHVLDRAKWDCDGMRDALRAYLLETLAASNAVLVVDETGFLKKGDTSAGGGPHARRPAGPRGKSEGGVLLFSVNPPAHAPLQTGAC